MNQFNDIEDIYQKLFGAIPESVCPLIVIAALGQLMQKYSIMASSRCEIFNDSNSEDEGSHDSKNDYLN